MKIGATARARLLAFSALSALTLFAASCAEGTRNVSTLSTEERSSLDICAAQRQPFISLEQTMVDEQRAWLVGGAVGGALLGAVVTGGDLRGVVGGAVVGVAAGYVVGLQRRTEKQADITAAIDGDVRATQSKFGSLRRQVSDLNACRMAQLSVIDQQVRRRQIDRTEARRQVAIVRRAVELDDELLVAVMSQGSARGGVMAQALASVGGSGDGGDRAAFNERQRRTSAPVSSVVFPQVQMYRPGDPPPTAVRAEQGEIQFVREARLRDSPSAQAEVMGTKPVGATARMTGRVQSGNWVRLAPQEGLTRSAFVAANETRRVPGQPSTPLQDYASELQDLSEHRLAERHRFEQQARRLDLG